MNIPKQYHDFGNLSEDEKADFLDSFFDEGYFQSYSLPALKNLLQSIIVQETKSYLRQCALEIYSSLVLIGKLSRQTLLGILLEDIEDNSDPFVQISRIRLLFLHYDASADADQVFEKLSRHLNADVSSEALYRKGLLAFLAIPQNGTSDFIAGLKFCHSHFFASSSIVENRIDAAYFAAVCDFILSLIAGQQEEYQTLLARCLNLLWRFEIFSNDENLSLSQHLGQVLSLSVDIVKKVSEESKWIDYDAELVEVFSLHQELINVQANGTFIDQTILKQFKQLTTSVISPLYSSNLIASSARLGVLIEKEIDPEYQGFLKEIQDSLNQNINKKKDNVQIIAFLARKYKNIPLQQIEADIPLISDDDPLSLAGLISAYAAKDATYSMTGYLQGDEVFALLRRAIERHIPEYSAEKLNSFSIVLSNVITYVVRSMQEKKEFFPELYNAKLATGKTEHIFQESLFRNLRQSGAGFRYLYEVNQSGGGRVDVTYNDNGLVFPVEVKKTKTQPSWQDIQADYLAQAQTYTNSYEQLGIFMVFELSDKTSHNAPINDIRELFKFQYLKTHYALGGNYPDGVVCIIVPANKVSPSSMSTYR
ncbi:hypothetical protein [Pedobacter endophyticus]|uniref:Uncharacterized protein n=1 Tax=Pedobacter endophyticus TaxID=2789740 RepID=A0A7U3SQ34_9SPHI|nr:hypothetical protein [Pedobacter endophyticus]QPH37886.1 hypothetical protein IZT61_12270 [Pedobacter endophyticus]